MCKSTENRWIIQRERPRLKIKAFYVRLSISEAQQPLPESITLLYLPRINESPLEINDSKIRSDVAAFVTLHRVRSAENNSTGTAHRDVVFATRERVRAREGVRFEVYLREEKILKGSFRRVVSGEEEEEEEWKLDCKCALDGELVGFAMSEAEVDLICEENVEISEKVEMVMRRNGRRKTHKFLDEIPEENEVDNELEYSDGCSCCDDTEMLSDCEEEKYWEVEEEMKMEGLSNLAVDVGIWVVCLGVGYLVSKASSKSLRRRGIL